MRLKGMIFVEIELLTDVCMQEAGQKKKKKKHTKTEKN